MKDTISFLDLVTPHRELEEELCGVLRSALATAGFIGGPMVQRFEEEFAAYCQTAHCVGVNSGTDAIRFALMAAGVGRGDVVVTVPHTFIATTEAITQAGADVAFVDIDERTYNMDPVKLREYLETSCEYDAASGALTDRRTGGRVRAIVPVHIYGQMADMDPIRALAEEFRLIVIEDSCQAHGADYYSQHDGKWLRAGSVGLAGAFSFYPGKNLGACGEAGAVTTNDGELARRMRMIRDHGQAKKYYHDVEGYNGRLDAIQAGFLSVKLRHLPAWTRQRQEAARRYRELFGDAPEGIVLPFEPAWSRAVYHLFVIRVPDREELQKRLASENIGTGIHYPIPLHLQNAYRHLGFGEGDFPVTEKIAREIVSLPMFPGLREEQQARVAEAVLDCLACLKS